MTTLDLTGTPVPTTAGPARAGVRDRTIAALVGLLFLVATLTFATADALLSSVLREPGYLAGSMPSGVLAAAALLALVDGVAVVAIAVLMYPVLHRSRQQSLGIAYVALRVAEFAAVLVYLSVPLVLLQLGASANLSGTSTFEVLSSAQHDAALVVIYLMTGLAGCAFAVALHRARLVPRAISVLGVVGYPVLLAGSVLALTGIVAVDEGPGMLALVPGGLFELLLPLWLLVKGFRTPTVG